MLVGRKIAAYRRGEENRRTEPTKVPTEGYQACAWIEKAEKERM
jgi:hypothetical protein